MKVGVVIVCAGQGRRLGGNNKGIFELKGRPLFWYSLCIFTKIKEIRQIVLVLRKKDFSLAGKIIRDRRIVLTSGGRERKDSVYRGLLALDKDIKYVLIHDGARPFVSKKMILALLGALRRYPAVIVGLKSTDTLKLAEGKYIKQTLPRNNIFRAQTPQGFKKDLLLKAYKIFRGRKLTDDAQAIELFGRRVKIIDGNPCNIKITYPEDIPLAEAVIRMNKANR